MTAQICLQCIQAGFLGLAALWNSAKLPFTSSTQSERRCGDMHLLLLLLILIGVATTIILIFLQLLCVKLCVFFPSAVGLLISSFSLSLSPRSGELRTQKLKSHLMRIQSLNVLPLKPRVGQYIAIYAMLTARNFFLISTLPVHSPAFFPKPLPISPVLAVANNGLCVGRQNKIGYPAGCRFPW